MSRFLAILGICLLVACTAEESKEKKRKRQANALAGGGVEMDMTLAQVGDTVITVGDFENEINRQAPHIRGRYKSLKKRKEFLDALVRFEVLAQEGKRRGFAQDPDVVRATKQAMIDRLYRDEFHTSDKSEPSSDEKAAFEAEKRSYYEQNLSEFQKEERMRAAAIVVKSKARAKRIAERAKGPEGESPKGFRDLVERHGEDDALSIRGGDLGFMDRNSTVVPKTVVDAVFALSLDGEVSGPIAAGGKYYILKRTAYLPPRQLTYEQAEADIAKTLMRDKRKEREKQFLQDLRSSADVEVHPERLRAINVKPGSVTP